MRDLVDHRKGGLDGIAFRLLSVSEDPGDNSLRRTLAESTAARPAAVSDNTDCAGIVRVCFAVDQAGALELDDLLGGARDLDPKVPGDLPDAGTAVEQPS